MTLNVDVTSSRLMLQSIWLVDCDEDVFYRKAHIGRLCSGRKVQVERRQVTLRTKDCSPLASSESGRKYSRPEAAPLTRTERSS